MTVENQFPYQSFTANGSQTNFALGFYVDNKDHFEVSKNDQAVSKNDYSYDKNSNSIIFNTSPKQGDVVEVKRSTTADRATTYATYNNTFRPETLNKDLDRIWLKLQELGVVDWFLNNKIDTLRTHTDVQDNLLQNNINNLKSYTDSQDNTLQGNIDNLKSHTDNQDSTLQNNINNLKNYVDVSDQEVTAYLKDRIREQGVALDQLNDYYKYLLDRLANTAKERGWTAEFITDSSGKNQQELNDSLKKIIDSRLWVEQFAYFDDLTVDAGPAFRRAIAYAKQHSYDTVWFRGNYKITSLEEGRWTMPCDNGSLPQAMVANDANGVLLPEPEITMPVHLFVPSGIGIKSENRRYNSLTFTWDRLTSPIDINQPIAIVQTCLDWDGTYTTPTSANAKNRYTQFSQGNFGGFDINNAFIGFLGDGVRHFDDWGVMKFSNCGLGMVTQGTDTCNYDQLQFTTCYAGKVNGGWWLQRAAASYGYMPLGLDIYAIGWCDAQTIGKLEYFCTTKNDVDRFELIDQFFDTYFWKTQNNTTRLSTTIDGTTPTTEAHIIKYTGVASRAEWKSPRQIRHGDNNTIDLVKVYGSLKPPLYTFEQTSIKSAFAEKVGLLDRTKAGAVVESNYYFKSNYNKYYEVDYLPSCVLEQSKISATTMNVSQASCVIDVSRANTPNTCTAANELGVEINTFDTGGAGLKINRYVKARDDTQRFISATYFYGEGLTSQATWQSVLEATGRHFYLRNGLTFKSPLISNLDSLGETLFKTVAFNSDNVNGTKLKVFTGANPTVGLQYELDGTLSWEQNRGVVKLYINLNLSPEVIAQSGELRIYLQKYSNNPPSTGSAKLGPVTPILHLGRCPNMVNPTAYPKGAALGVDPTHGLILTLMSEYNANSPIRANGYAEASTLSFIVEYRTADWN